MSQQELLRKVLEALEQARIEYMITGSIASSLQGEPRATHDIDLVVRLDEHAVPQLLRAFPPPEFYVEEAAVNAAIQGGGMFNVVEAAEGDKIDFWLLTDSPFDQSRFSRRYAERVFGLEITVSSPEDTILAKLHWASCLTSWSHYRSFATPRPTRPWSRERKPADCARACWGSDMKGCSCGSPEPGCELQRADPPYRRH